MWLVECSRFPPTTFVIVTNQKCQLYLVCWYGQGGIDDGLHDKGLVRSIFQKTVG